jgi:nuclear transport factor 2 (NTF2) superfamily protein
MARTLPAPRLVTARRGYPTAPDPRGRSRGTATIDQLGETATQKVQAAEDAWNTRDPERVSLAYSDRGGQWWRSYGNELWEFNQHGLMRRREASINDAPIEEGERRIFGPRDAGERGDSLPIR